MELLGEYFDLGDTLTSDTAVYKPRIVDDPTSTHAIKPAFITGLFNNVQIRTARKKF